MVLDIHPRYSGWRCKATILPNRRRSGHCNCRISSRDASQIEGFLTDFCFREPSSVRDGDDLPRLAELVLCRSKHRGKSGQRIGLLVEWRNSLNRYIDPPPTLGRAALITTPQPPHQAQSFILPTQPRLNGGIRTSPSETSIIDQESSGRGHHEHQTTNIHPRYTPPHYTLPRYTRFTPRYTPPQFTPRRHTPSRYGNLNDVEILLPIATGVSSDLVETTRQALPDSSGNASIDSIDSGSQSTLPTSVTEHGHGSLEPTHSRENPTNNFAGSVQGQRSSRENVGLRINERQASNNREGQILYGNEDNVLFGKYRSLINEMELVGAELTNRARAAETFSHVKATMTAASRIQRQVRQLDGAICCVLQQQTISGGTRKPLEGECLICQHVILDDQPVAWCRVCCGYNFHKECVESWKLVRGAHVDCPHW